MKQLILFGSLLILAASCTVQKQASTLNGRVDEVYFTASDTRKKVVEESEYDRQRSMQDENVPRSSSNAGNYTSSYSNRFRHFGSSSRFNYGNYTPTLVPTLTYNPYMGWSMGLSYVDPRFGYMSGFNSPFSPYYGYNMPYYDPFYSYGWGSGWMYGYYPFHTFNPYFYNPCSYNYGYGYGYYNPYYKNYYYKNYQNSNGSSSNYGRRTGSSTNMPSSNTTTNQPQNNSSNSGSNTGSKWYSNGGNRGGSTSTGGSTGGSSGGGNRGSSGSGGSTRRR